MTEQDRADAEVERQMDEQVRIAEEQSDAAKQHERWQLTEGMAFGDLMAHMEQDAEKMGELLAWSDKGLAERRVA